MKYKLGVIFSLLVSVLSAQPCTLTNKLPISSNHMSWRVLFIPKLTMAPSGQINNTTNATPYKVVGDDPNWNKTPYHIISSCKNAKIRAKNKFNTQPWRFGLTFKITKRLRYTIDGVFRCDDHGSFSIKKRNGEILYTKSTPNPASLVSTNLNFNDFLDPGVYYLEVNVFNNDGEYLGFSIDGNLTSPENTISSSFFYHCVPTTFLAIETIRDKNCNGIFDDGDALLPNAIYKYNYGGKPGTVNADSNGEALIAGLSQGNLNLTINPMDGYRPFNNEPTRPITLPPTGVKRVSYFVCKN